MIPFTSKSPVTQYNISSPLHQIFQYNEVVCVKADKELNLASEAVIIVKYEDETFRNARTSTNVCHYKEKP